MLKMIQAKYRSSYWLPESRRNIKLTRVQELDETSIVGKELIKYYPDNCEVDGQPYIQTLGGGSSLTTEQTYTLTKLDGIESSASEIDNAVDSLSKGRLNKVQKLFRDAANRINKNVVYYISGDSTRNNFNNRMIDYYNVQLSKLNISIYNNSSSGQTVLDWLNNTDQTTLQNLIDNTVGDGSNAIVEFSYGINDINGGTSESELKTLIKSGLDSYLSAKPLANIILCTPVTFNASLNIILNRIYIELSNEYNLYLVDVESITSPVYNNSLYYYDNIHPNKWGSRRVLNYILSEILPIDVQGILTIDEFLLSLPDTSELNIGTSYESGYYDKNDGTAKESTIWWRIPIIVVEPNFTIEYTYQAPFGGFVIFTDINDVFVSWTYPTTVSTYVYNVVVPLNAHYMKIVISNQGEDYNVLNDTPSVKYKEEADTFLSVKKINEGFNCLSPINKFSSDNILIDDYGKTGIGGQSLMIDTNNKMKWS